MDKTLGQLFEGIEERLDALTEQVERIADMMAVDGPPLRDENEDWARGLGDRADMDVYGSVQ